MLSLSLPVDNLIGTRSRFIHLPHPTPPQVPNLASFRGITGSSSFSSWEPWPRTPSSFPLQRISLKPPDAYDGFWRIQILLKADIGLAQGSHRDGFMPALTVVLNFPRGWRSEAMWEFCGKEGSSVLKPILWKKLTTRHPSADRDSHLHSSLEL